MKNYSTIPDQTTIQRIAIFRALYLGDMLCIIPAVRAVRLAFPSARITLIGLAWQNEFVKRFSQYFDDHIDFPGWPGLPEQQVHKDMIVDFLWRMRSERYDLVLQMHGNGFVTNKLCALWNAEFLCGLSSIHQPVPDKGIFPVSEDDEHEIKRFLKITDALSLPSAGTHLEFNIAWEEVMNFEKMQASTPLLSGNYICIHAGARDPRRRWPMENFALVANHLCKAGHQIVLTGSLSEKKLLQTLEEKIFCPVINIVDRFGDIGLGELACFIQHADLLVSNDTGVSHIAAALKVPSVILFSPYSDIGRWAPLDRERHLVIPSEENTDPTVVLTYVQRQLLKYSTQPLPALFNNE